MVTSMALFSMSQITRPLGELAQFVIALGLTPTWVIIVACFPGTNFGELKNIMYNEIANGASGVLKGTCQFDDGLDAHIYLTNSNSDNFK